jgi:hypothetical protein
MGWSKPEWGKIVGPTEGLAMEAFHAWLAVGLLDMALVEFGKEHGASSDFGVKYVFGVLKLLWALKQGRGYDRAYIHFELLARAQPGGAAKEHLLALAKSIRAAAPCKLCLGTHRIRCKSCHGKKKVDLQCNTCGGSGKKQTLKGVVACRGCNGAGTFRDVECPRCKATGETDCTVKGCKAVPPPRQEDMITAVPWHVVSARGADLRGVRGRRVLREAEARSGEGAQVGALARSPRRSGSTGSNAAGGAK